MPDAFTLAADALDPTPQQGTQEFFCPDRDCDGRPHDAWPWRHARGQQHPPEGNWYLWLIRAGRGWGKTRVGGEWIVDRAKKWPGSYWGLAGPTFDDIRDLMVEGESGLEYVLDQHKVRYDWNRSLGQITLFNGARFDFFSGEKPDSFRGPNLAGCWGDEPASWKYGAKCWSNLKLMTRKGHPQIVLTGTPKNTQFVRTLISEADHITTGTSDDNRENLADIWYKKVIEPLKGTRLGLQEVMGQVLEDVEGALWRMEQIERGRRPAPNRYRRIVVSLDPAASDPRDSKEEPDEHGIIAGGYFNDHGYIFEDRSGIFAPLGAAQTAIDCYHELRADALVYEGNKGGKWIKELINLLDPSVHVVQVNASRGKLTRAEPVAALYGDHTNPATWDRATVHHVQGVDLSTLEDQMCTWEQGDPNSPDRMDALVWNVVQLMNLGKKGGRGGLRYRD